MEEGKTISNHLDLSKASCVYVIIDGSIYSHYGSTKGLQVLTEEQVAFHKEHPAASTAEVLACTLTPEPPAPDLDGYKEQARRLLREIVSAYLHAKVDHDKLQEALVIKTTGTASETVSMQVAEDRITYYSRMVAMLKTYTLETYMKIHACENVEQVDEVVSGIDMQSLNLV